jgi:hypothetical protein
VRIFYKWGVRAFVCWLLFEEGAPVAQAASTPQNWPVGLAAIVNASPKTVKKC